MAEHTNQSKNTASRPAPQPKAAPEALPEREPAAGALTHAVPRAGAPIDPNTLNPSAVLRMQRTLGNRAVTGILNQGGAIQPKTDPSPAPDPGASSVKPINTWLAGFHPGLDLARRQDARFRLPEFDRIKAAIEDPDLKIPFDVVKSRVETLLNRMAKEGRLKTKDDVPTIMGKMFPGPGKIDEVAFNAALDVNDRSVIYQNIKDAFTTVKKGDKPGLKTAIGESIDLINNAIANDAGLKQVFGSRADDAKAVYGKAAKALQQARTSMNAHVSTDYNLDDKEVGLGGWASHDSGHMHLLVEVVKVTDPADAKITLIHEAAHLANPGVDDEGYYGSDGFEAMPEDKKFGNAAHYEELPRRELGTSQFPKHTFTPGKKKGGGVVTEQDEIERMASEHMRKAWDAAVDTNSFLRDVRLAYLNGSRKPFNDNRAIINEISLLIDLTIHEQDPKEALVTTLDITTSESIARAMGIIGNKLDKVTFPTAMLGKSTKEDIRDHLVAEATTAYGELLHDAARDKKLIDWMVAHYRNIPSV